MTQKYDCHKTMTCHGFHTFAVMNLHFVFVLVNVYADFLFMYSKNTADPWILNY